MAPEAAGEAQQAQQGRGAAEGESGAAKKRGWGLSIIVSKNTSKDKEARVVVVALLACGWGGGRCLRSWRRAVQGRLGWSAEGLQEHWAGPVAGSREQAKRLLKQGARSSTACPAARPLQVIPAAPPAAAAAPESHMGSKYKGYQEKLRRHHSGERVGWSSGGARVLCGVVWSSMGVAGLCPSAQRWRRS